MQIRRYGYQQEFSDFLNATGMTYVTDINGKGILSEENPHFAGILDGHLATKRVQEIVKASDVVFQIGLLVTDLSIVGTTLEQLTGGKPWLVLNSYCASGQNNFFAYQVPLGDFLTAFTQRIKKEGFGNFKRSIPPLTKSYQKAIDLSHDPLTHPLTYDWFVKTLNDSKLIGDDTVLLSDATLVTFPIVNDIIVQQDSFYAEFGWGSIGFTSGASVGVKFAFPEKRIITVIGDGGLQNCPTGLSTIARQKQNTIVFVLVNNIYAIDQWLVDPTVLYDPSKPVPEENVLAGWNYVKLAEAFGGKGWNTKTVDGLIGAIEQAKIYPGLSVIAVHIPEKDVPEVCKLESDGTKQFSSIH